VLLRVVTLGQMHYVAARDVVDSDFFLKVLRSQGSDRDQYREYARLTQPAMKGSFRGFELHYCF
jgi:hypothetical protein